MCYTSIWPYCVQKKGAFVKPVGWIRRKSLSCVGACSERGVKSFRRHGQVPRSDSPRSRGSVRGVLSMAPCGFDASFGEGHAGAQLAGLFRAVAFGDSGRLTAGVAEVGLSAGYCSKASAAGSAAFGDSDRRAAGVAGTATVRVEFAGISHSAGGFAGNGNSAGGFAGNGHSAGTRLALLQISANPCALWRNPANPFALCSIPANPFALCSIPANPSALWPFSANSFCTDAEASKSDCTATKASKYICTVADSGKPPRTVAKASKPRPRDGRSKRTIPYDVRPARAPALPGPKGPARRRRLASSERCSMVTPTQNDEEPLFPDGFEVHCTHAPGTTRCRLCAPHWQLAILYAQD